MPYYDKKKKRWIAHVMKKGKRKQGSFMTMKEAKKFEAEYQRLSTENWNKKLEPISLETWAVEYLKFCKSRYTKQTYEDKVREFKFFFAVIDKDSSMFHFIECLSVDQSSG